MELSHVDLSNLLGAVSLSFWLCNGIPLVLEIYRRRSADGVALGFVLLWTIGDVLNLAGSIWAGLVPSVIFVACYYILSDLVILGEALYFGSEEPEKRDALLNADVERALGEAEGQLSRHPERDTQRQRRRTMDEHAPLLVSAGPAELYNIDSRMGNEDETPSGVLKETMYNVLACVGVTALGIVGWYVSTMVTHDGPMGASPGATDVVTYMLGHKHHGHGRRREHIDIGPQILGYASAALYLLARVPQIVKNYRKQRTDGLALLFFIFSVMGNLTYAASIVTFSGERTYLLTNVPWLLGSLGTLVFDFVILGQFLLYRNKPELEDEDEDEGERSLLST